MGRSKVILAIYGWKTLYRQAEGGVDMMHFRQRTIVVYNEGQAKKYFMKRSKWRRGTKRHKRFRKSVKTQKGHQGKNRGDRR